MLLEVTNHRYYISLKSNFKSCERLHTLRRHPSFHRAMVGASWRSDRCAKRRGPKERQESDCNLSIVQ